MTRRRHYPKPAPGQRRRSSAVTVIKPDPRVWARALVLAGHDPRRLRVMDDGEVIVLNDGRRRS